MPIARSLERYNTYIAPAPAPATPNYYSTATSGQWSTLPNSQLSAAADFNSLDYVTIAAYSGAIINTTGVYYGSTFISGTFLVIWGQGHSDGGRNTVYAYGPFESDSATWRRLRDATSPAPQNVNEDGSGNPVARHTYDTLAYDPVNNRMISMGGLARYSDAGGDSLVHYFDFNQASPETNSPWHTLSNTSWGGAADTTAYDSTTSRIWYHPNVLNSVSYYDVTANTHNNSNFKSPGWGTPTATTSAIDTSRGIWAIISGSILNFYQLNNGTSNDYYAPTTTGTAPTGDASIVYDPAADRFVVWSNGGKTLFFLTPPASLPYAGGNAWTWSSSTPGAGSTPTAEAGTSGTGESGTLVGTYGRFNIVNAVSGALRVYVLLNRAADSIYFYKP